jgi:hypothetical protein
VGAISESQLRGAKHGFRVLLLNVLLQGDAYRSVDVCFFSARYGDRVCLLVPSYSYQKVFSSLLSVGGETVGIFVRCETCVHKLHLAIFEDVLRNPSLPAADVGSRNTGCNNEKGDDGENHVDSYFGGLGGGLRYVWSVVDDGTRESQNLADMR